MHALTGKPIRPCSTPPGKKNIKKTKPKNTAKKVIKSTQEKI